MKIESIRIRNYKVFRNAEAKDIPELAVFIAKNGCGKTTFFDVFGFLHDCLAGNVSSALLKRGGYREVVSRDHEGEDISFAIKFRQAKNEPLMTYELAVGQDDQKRAVVKKEVLRMRRGEKGSPWKILDFAFGEGTAANGFLKAYNDVQLAERKTQKLDSPDILAIKGLGQFQDFAAVAAFRKLVEDWYVSDFRIDAARERQEAGYGGHLSRTGDNLAVVAKHIHEHHPELFADIMEKMRQRVPGVRNVEAQETQDGYIVLRFQDGEFKNPFSARLVSDGTIKMFMYLVLLHDPARHELLCVEEPESQLYPELLEELAEEFQAYAKSGQVFISTHSPDFLNAMPLDAIYTLEKADGYSVIKRAKDNELALRLYREGDLPGALWREGILGAGK
ncbi:MAG: AAA family ATPase [Deltaproteobacteria bacterium]|nr:AAA family ATPase [Deltaproteobacteria bacterium]